MAFLNPAFTNTKLVTLKDIKNLQGFIPVETPIGGEKEAEVRSVEKKARFLNLGVRGGCVLYITEKQTIKGTTISGNRVTIEALPGLLPIWFRSLDVDGFKEGTVTALY
jgi:hypothetical protein